MSPPTLELSNLSAGYDKRSVLTDVSVRIERGEWFCVLGPNGVGKSTLLQCVAGRIQTTHGDVLIDGRSVARDPTGAKRGLGYACAPEELPELLTGRQCLEVYASAKGLCRVDPDVALLAERLRFRGWLDRCVDTYSLGTRQKLCILLALLGAPSLVVLDESFNGLDPASSLIVKRELQGRLAEGRCAVLLATHSLDIVEHYADRAALLLEGRIVREWAKAEILDLRARGARAFEEELAAGVDGA